MPTTVPGTNEVDCLHVDIGSLCLSLPSGGVQQNHLIQVAEFQISLAAAEVFQDTCLVCII